MNSQLLSIKAKKFGVRLAAFRQKKGLTTEIMSQWTGISSEKLQGIEQGEFTATLPEIELIALKMGFPPETIIAGEIQPPTAAAATEDTVQQYVDLRNRMIALILRKTRLEQGLSFESVASKCSLETNEVEQYESGSKSIPLPVLESLCAAYQIPVFSLISQKNAIVSSPTADTSRFQSNHDLPEDISDFVNNPANLPYLELARKLSELDAVKLRSIAEGLLEITY